MALWPSGCASRRLQWPPYRTYMPGNNHPFPVCCGCGFFMSGRKVHTETLQCPCQVDSGPSFQGPVQAWLVFNSAVSWCVAIAFKARSCFARLVGGSCQATTLGLWGEALDGKRFDLVVAWQEDVWFCGALAGRNLLWWLGKESM
eukprot:1152389-Pelagomonas_calceolata.AAC.2